MYDMRNEISVHTRASAAAYPNKWNRVLLRAELDSFGTLFGNEPRSLNIDDAAAARADLAALFTSRNAVSCRLATRAKWGARAKQVRLITRVGNQQYRMSSIYCIYYKCGDNTKLGSRGEASVGGCKKKTLAPLEDGLQAELHLNVKKYIIISNVKMLHDYLPYGVVRQEKGERKVNKKFLRVCPEGGRPSLSRPADAHGSCIGYSLNDLSVLERSLSDEPPH
ncbi:hypothetical protein EVAR_81175_1 [Eumeta japonica]|uniref:Uncharacterized protein n=1 Tax=Eumeta variegata TaxID=151549 RepID=A0A4C1UKX8_EUMVA|nr:hypothetical protein EVAR_81175_1 [Eumeta japonica]